MAELSERAAAVHSGVVDPVSYTHLDVYKRQGLADAFDAEKTAWAGEYKELKAALTEEEYAAARASTCLLYTSTLPLCRNHSRSGVCRSEVPHERQNSHGYGLEAICRKAG